ncbi:uncharacterized protein LOC125645821 [Ostrea edulis]|uniref:uncharacterized protein LOC125645821 n=1 Tax=Ostrea edulis TaxID=37623 RepID=UPI00209655CA|nr:uncharacterized protein LOC125645821 [Ostrea edulis]XP_048727632.1 uncharacterized protein LOC125645821 [Ostrea edulis]
MKVVLSLAVFAVVILLTEGNPNKLAKTMNSFRNNFPKQSLSPLLRKIRSSPEIFPASDDKQIENVDQVGDRLMEDFIYFLTLQDLGVLDRCLSFRK